MADLNAAGDAERALAVGGGVAFLDRAKVMAIDLRDLLCDIAPACADQVKAVFVRATYKVRKFARALIHHEANGLGQPVQPDWTDESGLAPEGRDDFFLGRQPEVARHAQRLGGLDLIEFVVATDANGAGAVEPHHDQCLHALRRLYAQEF